jgi:hypothetical protein
VEYSKFLGVPLSDERIDMFSDGYRDDPLPPLLDASKFATEEPVAAAGTTRLIGRAVGNGHCRRIGKAPA